MIQFIFGHLDLTRDEFDQYYIPKINKVGRVTEIPLNDPMYKIMVLGYVGEQIRKLFDREIENLDQIKEISMYEKRKKLITWKY